MSRMKEDAGTIAGIGSNRFRDVRSGQCPVCHHPKSRFCQVFDEGTICLCKYVSSDRERVNDLGHVYWIHNLDDAQATFARETMPDPTRSEARGDLVNIDRVYNALFSALTLSDAHRKRLRDRGLSDEAITAGRYRTMPLPGRSALARAMVEQFGEAEVRGVPGFYVAEQGERRWWSLAGCPGMLIPCRDVTGRIVAIKIRRDDLPETETSMLPGQEMPRYLLLSSASRGGPSALSTCHVPLGFDGPRDVVWVSEGELKSDVTTSLSGILTLSAPGVGGWKTVLATLDAIKPEEVHVVYDQDAATNMIVARAQQDLLKAISAKGWKAGSQAWPAGHKGIDDYLAYCHANGETPDLVLTPYPPPKTPPAAPTPPSPPRPPTPPTGGSVPPPPRDPPPTGGAGGGAETPPPPPATPPGDGENPFPDLPAVDPLLTLPNERWRAVLQDDDGDLEATLAVGAAILRNEEPYRGELAYNEMLCMPTLGGKPIDDVRLTRIRERIELQFGVALSENVAHHAVLNVASERSFHPVAQYLDPKRLKWDGTPRIDEVATKVLRLKDPSPIERLMLRRWFISAVARALEPGCQCDTALVLVGPPGSYKSSFFRTLAGAWFGDSYMDIHNKDSLMQLASTWIYEWGEIEKITSKKDEGIVKNFISSEADTLRLPYARVIKTVPRRSCIVGTTNKYQFLIDETGSRRFWPLGVKDRFNLDLLVRWKDQLWAEAVVQYSVGAIWHLEPEDELAREQTSERYQETNPWLSPIQRWLDSNPHGWVCYTSEEIMTEALSIPTERHSKPFEQRVAACLTALGWTRAKKRIERPDPKNDNMKRSKNPIWAWYAPAEYLADHGIPDAE